MIKNKVLVHKGVEPVTFHSLHKTLPTEPRAQCDMEMVPFDKILSLRKSLKFKNGAKAMFFFLKNSFAKSKLTCSFLDEIEKCKHAIYSVFYKEHNCDL